MEWHSTSAQKTEEWGRQLLQRFPNASVICLKGPLGSGKTCFTKGIGLELGVPSERIKSPTFTTAMEHTGKKTLIHCDFYRHEQNPLGSRDWWNEMLERKNVLIVAEWSEHIPGDLPPERIEVEFKIQTDNTRILLIQVLS